MSTQIYSPVQIYYYFTLLTHLFKTKEYLNKWPMSLNWNYLYFVRASYLWSDRKFKQTCFPYIFAIQQNNLQFNPANYKGTGLTGLCDEIPPIPYDTTTFLPKMQTPWIRQLHHCRPQISFRLPTGGIIASVRDCNIYHGFLHLCALPTLHK